MFERGASGWSEAAKLTADYAQALDRFGNSVSVSGGLVGVGAYNSGASSGSAIGAADVFETPVACAAESVQIASLQGDLTQCQADLTASSGQNAQLQSDLTAANATITSQAGQISSLNATVSTQAGQISSLNATVTSQTGQITSLTSDLAAANQTIQDKNAEISTLTADLTAANQTIAERDATISSMILSFLQKKSVDEIAAAAIRDAVRKTIDDAFAQGETSAKNIAKAEKEYAKGMSEMNKVRYDKAVKHFKKAYQHVTKK